MTHTVPGWSGHPAGERDIKKIVLAYAILAPSPHNIQPWTVEFPGSDRINLYIDGDRLLPASDPDYRMIYISHGAFIENLDIAARQFGYRTDIDLFPGVWPGSGLVIDTPVARIDLVKKPDSVKDPLFHNILKRVSNRRPYNRSGLSTKQAEALSDAYDTSYIPISLATDPEMCRNIAGYIVRASEIGFSKKEIMDEMLRCFRSGKALEKARDGTGFAQYGISGPGRIIFDYLIYSRAKAGSPGSAFSADLMKRTRKQAYSTSCYGWISTKGNTRPDQIRTGRCFERVCLAAAGLGLAIQPFGQILAQYPEMKDLYDEFREFLGISDTHTLQMLFRSGHAKPVPHTPRRPLGDFIRKGT